MQQNTILDPNVIFDFLRKWYNHIKFKFCKTLWVFVFCHFRVIDEKVMVPWLWWHYEDWSDYKSISYVYLELFVMYILWLSRKNCMYASLLSLFWYVTMKIWIHPWWSDILWQKYVFVMMNLDWLDYKVIFK